MMDLTRRNLVKLGISVTAGLGLSPFIKGCTLLTKRIQEDVENIQWDANPRIPIPKNGCYAGWHSGMIQDYMDMDRTRLLNRWKKVDASSVERHLNYHELKANCLPAVFSFSNMHIGADWFPHEICDILHRIGVIPLIRFFPTYDFSSLAKGKFDDELKSFALSVAQFGKPLFFVPWPMINRIITTKGHVHRWVRPDPEAAKAAWTHLYEIFKNTGANEYAIWGFHILPSDSRESIEKFKLAPKLLDWLGFTIFTIEYNWPQQNFSIDLMDAYEWAQLNYPRKPIALFEIGRGMTKGQGRWITTAYKRIKQLPRIKMVMYAETEAGFARYIGDYTGIGEEAKPAYKEALADPYLIKGGQQVKEMLNFKQSR